MMMRLFFLYLPALTQGGLNWGPPLWHAQQMSKKNPSFLLEDQKNRSLLNPFPSPAIITELYCYGGQQSGSVEQWIVHQISNLERKPVSWTKRIRKRCLSIIHCFFWRGPYHIELYDRSRGPCLREFHISIRKTQEKGTLGAKEYEEILARIELEEITCYCI